MKTILMILIVLMAQGCRTYSIEKQTPDGTIKVYVQSSADMKAPNVHYKRDGDDVTFDFSAEEIDNNTEAYLGIFQGIMVAMMEMMQMQMQMQMMPPVVNE